MSIYRPTYTVESVRGDLDSAILLLNELRRELIELDEEIVYLQRQLTRDEGIIKGYKESLGVVIKIFKEKEYL